jgi:hypothetical protein
MTALTTYVENNHYKYPSNYEECKPIFYDLAEDILDRDMLSRENALLRLRCSVVWSELEDISGCLVEPEQAINWN